MPSALNAGDARIFGTHVCEERVGRHRPAGLAVDARLVVAVVAEVRRDVRRGSASSPPTQVGVSASSRRRSASHSRRVDDRVEVHERVVAGRVHVGLRRDHRRVRRADRRMAARLRLGRRVADVLLVRLPGLARGVELVGDRLAPTSGTRSPCPSAWPYCAGAGRDELGVRRAVGLRRGFGACPLICAM